MDMYTFIYMYFLMILAWDCPFNDHEIYVYIVVYACHYER